MRRGQEEEEEEAGAEQRCCCPGSISFLQSGDASPGPAGDDGQRSILERLILCPCPKHSPHTPRGVPLPGCQH